MTEITQADIDALRTLEPRKSILNFSADELEATEKWAKKFQDELSEKSPFYRLTNGDWRENDKTRVHIISFSNKKISFSEIKEDVKNNLIERGAFANVDTGWNIQVSRKGIEDTIRYAFKHNDNISYNMLYDIKEFIESGILLDSVISEKNNPNKAHDTIFMHKMYCVCSVDNEPHIAKITIEEFANVNGETIKRLYNLQDLKIEPLRIIGLTDNQLRPSVLNGSDISISDLFQIVKTFDKDFYLNKRNEKQIENFPIGDERIDNMAETTQELLERIAALEKQVSVMATEQQNLKEQINTVNQFISSITESQNFEQSMSTIESMGKQVLDCEKAEFWCYDSAENKYFTNDENRGGRDWQIAEENMRIAAESKLPHIADNSAYIPIISNDKVAGILIASEKDGVFDRTSLEKFAPNSQIANTIDLSLKKEFEHQGRITDELTRLKNRQGAKEYAANTMAHNINDAKDMCIIMCDIDHFKSINDTYGHDAGDTVLKNVAGILQSGTRQGADSTFRWGGEEMVCVLNCDYEHAMDIAERLRSQIESTTHLVYDSDKQPTNVSVTISMGVHQINHDISREVTPENAFNFFETQLKFADELAYKAKESGRNMVVGEKDIAPNIEKEGYSIYSVELNGEIMNFRDTATDIDTLMKRYADCEGYYPIFTENCKRISDVEFAELEQSGDPLPSFCAEINIDNNTLTVWDNEKIASTELSTAISNIKENNTVDLNYNDFPSNDLETLNNVYDSFLYNNDIFNDAHIDFMDKHELPPNLNSAENRFTVSEYINTQLNKGSITESQRESLKEMQQSIRHYEEPLFTEKINEISQWANEVIDKFNSRSEQEQNRDDVAR